MTKEIKDGILPVYEKLLNKNTFTNICTFAVQWGKNFPSENKTGLLFIGKAVNGWVTNETNVEKLFDQENSDRIFARKDQMEWVDNLSGNTKGYNTRKSAFWRVIKKVAMSYYPQKWYSNIAWSNLYKIAPWEGGNPNTKLQKVQQKYCFEILKKEIEVLSPDYIIMLTSGWEWPFLNYLNNSEKLNVLSEIKWNKYKTKLIEIDGTKFIISPHPQGKNESEHKQVICQLMNESK